MRKKKMQQKRKDRLPDFFQEVMWSYDVQKISINSAKKEILVNTLNYGQWHHLEWLVRRWGKKEIVEILKEIPESELRPPALALAKVLFKIHKLPYALRSDKIRS